MNDIINCKAAVLYDMSAKRPYSETKPLKIENIELDPPGFGEVLVKVKAAGLCHSDLSVVKGKRPRAMPMVLGHEGSGVVEKIGEGVKNLEVGDHVVLEVFSLGGKPFEK